MQVATAVFCQVIKQVLLILLAITEKVLCCTSAVLLVISVLFLKLYTDKPKFSEKCSFKTWLYTIGKNLAVDHIRRYSKHKEVPLDDLYDISDKENIEKNHIRSEEKRQLLRAMEQLNDEYRQVLYLVFFEDFSNTEAAAIMGKSERQIRNLLYRSKETLRKILEKEGFSYEGI